MSRCKLKNAYFCSVYTGPKNYSSNLTYYLIKKLNESNSKRRSLSTQIIDKLYSIVCIKIYSLVYFEVIGENKTTEQRRTNNLQPTVSKWIIFDPVCGKYYLIYQFGSLNSVYNE